MNRAERRNPDRRSCAKRIALFAFIILGLITCPPIHAQSASLDELTARANQGDPRAQHDLGLLYLEGKAVQADYPAAARWFQLAAAQGDAASEFALGELYEEGAGVPQDFVKAYAWMTRAISKAPGATEYTSRRDSLAAKMTDDQIAEAQQFTGEQTPGENRSATASAKEPQPSETKPASQEPPPPVLQTPPPISAPDETDTFSVVMGFLMIAVIIGTIIFFKVRARGKLSAKPEKMGYRDGFIEARVGVPHAGFRWTGKGCFEVALKNKRGPNDGVFSSFKPHPDTHIEVTDDAVIINKFRLRREQFGPFLPWSTIQTPYNIWDQDLLAYRYGTDHFTIPGWWTKRETLEIASALNRLLDTPPEDLEDPRPTDF